MVFYFLYLHRLKKVRFSCFFVIKFVPININKLVEFFKSRIDKLRFKLLHFIMVNNWDDHDKIYSTCWYLRFQTVQKICCKYMPSSLNTKYDIGYFSFLVFEHQIRQWKLMIWNIIEIYFLCTYFIDIFYCLLFRT